MNSLTSHSVVDRMTADLAERRHKMIRRNAAYEALARAILSDEASELTTRPAFEYQAGSIGQSTLAA